MSNKAHETNAIKELRKKAKHWYCYKTHGGMYQSGLPDLIVFNRKTHSMLFIECKMTGNVVTPKQQDMLHNISKCNGFAIILYFPKDEDDRYLVYSSKDKGKGCETLLDMKLNLFTSLTQVIDFIDRLSETI